MKTLTKDQILAAHDLETRAVEVKAWGGKVNVSELSADASAAFAAATFDEDGNQIRDGKSWKVKLVAACVVDDEGKRLFSDEDVAALGAKSNSAIAKLYEAAAELNGFGPKAKEDAEKN